jgi:hypothetical protein
VGCWDAQNREPSSGVVYAVGDGKSSASQIGADKNVVGRGRQVSGVPACIEARETSVHVEQSEGPMQGCRGEVGAGVGAAEGRRSTYSDGRENFREDRVEHEERGGVGGSELTKTEMAAE